MFQLIERFKNYLDALEFDFCRWRYYAMGVSGALMALTFVLFFAVGPNWGTDFTGGTEIQLKFEQPIPIERMREGLRHLGLGDESVQAINGTDSGEFVIRIADPTFGLDGMEQEVRAALEAKYGGEWIQAMTSNAEVSARFLVTYAGPSVDHAEVGRTMQQAFPGTSVAPGLEEQQVSISIPGLAQRIEARIATEFANEPFVVLSTDSVGPQVGAELRRNGFVAMVATMALILVYVAFRFDVEYAPGAVVALFHDVTMTVLVFIVFQLDFSLATIGALLTILGYSINDTIVIYDRIRENRSKFRRGDTVTLINKSVSETLTRTLATAGTTFLAIVTFLIWGGPVLRDFAIAMLCGIIFGSYSTVYIASPLIIVFEDLKPWLSRLVAVRDDDGDDGLPTAGPDGDDGGDQPPMLTESEKRRRARAQPDKKEQLG